jgi:hypothetical protein
MVFFVIQIKSRAVQIAGIRVDPDEAWMKQVARNLTDPVNRDPSRRRQPRRGRAGPLPSCEVGLGAEEVVVAHVR